MWHFRILVLVILSVTNSVFSNEKKVVCYYGTWATYRGGLGKFDVDNINVNLCTHIVYTFVGVNSDGSIAILDPYLDLGDNWGRDNFRKFNELKLRNPNLKTILAVGGWNEGSAKFSRIAADTKLRKNFISTSLNLLIEHGFDGFDIDWEYPNRRDTVHGADDVVNFTQLLKELKEELQKHNLLLSIAAASVGNMASLSYDIPNISKYVDFVNLMTYDMYGAWDPVTGHNAGLHRGEGDETTPKQQLYTVDMALEYWIRAGCPPEKLILGLPLYGRTFTLVDGNNNAVRAPASGVGIAGPYTETNGLIGYNEFCVILQAGGWEERYDDLARVPYAVQGNKWVSYDNPTSLMTKVEYALTLGIGGAMVWSIETDDFHGLCQDEDFPMLRAVNRALKRSVNEIATTTETSTITTCTSTTTTTTETSSTEASTSTTTDASTGASTSTTTEGSPSISTTHSSLLCKEEGPTSDPDNCTRFVYCIRDFNGDLVPIEFQCPTGLLWDQSITACNYRDSVHC